VRAFEAVTTYADRYDLDILNLAHHYIFVSWPWFKKTHRKGLRFGRVTAKNSLKFWAVGKSGP